MARHFFDIHNGTEFFRDTEGHECAGKESIRHEATRALPEIARHAIPVRAHDTQAFTLLVRDEGNRTVFSATMTFAGVWMDDPADG